MTRVWPIVGLLWALGCVKDPHALYGTQPWSPKYVHLTIPPDAPDCAWWAAASAWDYLRPTAGLVMGFAPPKEPRRGDIVVEWIDPGPRWKGETTTSHLAGAPFASHVRLKSCETRLFAHELAHALGLADVDAPGRLMHHAYPQAGWALTPTELAILRPERP